MMRLRLSLDAPPEFSAWISHPDFAIRHTVRALRELIQRDYWMADERALEMNVDAGLGREVWSVVLDFPLVLPIRGSANPDGRISHTHKPPA